MLNNKNYTRTSNFDYDECGKNNNDQFTQENYLNLPAMSDEDVDFHDVLTGINQEYFVVLPENIDILREVRNKIGAIKDGPAKEDARKFVLEVQSVLISLAEKQHISNKLPVMAIHEMDDDSVLLEWALKDFRIGFSFEANNNHSTWFLFADKKLKLFDAAGHLNVDETKPLIINFINFVLRYT